MEHKGSVAIQVLRWCDVLNLTTRQASYISSEGPNCPRRDRREHHQFPPCLIHMESLLCNGGLSDMADQNRPVEQREIMDGSSGATDHPTGHNQHPKRPPDLILDDSSHRFGWSL
jgi:hypothetical protein